MMKRFIASFSALAILMWVMPLGAFIKASQEKTACHGARAMHMCTMEFGSASSSSAVVGFRSDTSSEQAPKAKIAGGAELFLEGADPKMSRRSGLMTTGVIGTPRSYVSPTTTPPPKSPLFF